MKDFGYFEVYFVYFCHKLPNCDENRSIVVVDSQVDSIPGQKRNGGPATSVTARNREVHECQESYTVGGDGLSHVAAMAYPTADRIRERG